MCDISPFGMKCVFDDCKDDTAQCLACRTRFYLQQLKFSLPVIGKLFENWENKFMCPYFEPKPDDEEEIEMEKCRTCMSRYECKGKIWYDCQIDNYKYYTPDDKAIAEVEKEMQECKAKQGGKQLKWKEGVDSMWTEIKEIKKEIGNEKYIHVVMQDGKELVYLDRMHTVKFDGYWLIIKGGFSLDEIVFATHADNMRYMYVDK